MGRPKQLVGLTILAVLVASGAMGQTYTGPDSGFNNNWPVGANWSGGSAPSMGSGNVYIPAGIRAHGSGDPLLQVQQYNGNLTISNNAEIGIGWLSTNSLLVMGTPGSTRIYMHEGASIDVRVGVNGLAYDVPRIDLLGNAFFSMSRSTTQPSDPDFNYTIAGAYSITFHGKGGCEADLNASNSVSHMIADPQYGSGFELLANVPGSLGSGDVTIRENPSTGIRCAILTINASNAMDPSCILTLNGPDSTDRITLNADNTISELFLDNVRQESGTYGRIGNTNVDYEVLWCLGDGILTVTGPTLSYWDINGATAGTGTNAPAGTWDGVTANWSTSEDGTAATAAWSAGDRAAFAAGTDATGTYSVTVSGTRDVGGVYFEEGDVTLTGGSLEMVSKTYFNVSDDVTAILDTVVTNDATAWQFVKNGDGTLIPTKANTYTGTTRIEGGTLVVSNLQAVGTPSCIGAYPDVSPDGLLLAGGGTFDYRGGSITNDRGFGMQGDGTINIASNYTRLVMSTCMSSKIQGTLTVTGGEATSFEMSKLVLEQGVGLTIKPMGTTSVTVDSVWGHTQYPYPATPLTLSGESVNNYIVAAISNYHTGNWPRPVTVTKRGTGTWSVLGGYSSGGALTVYEGTMVMAGTNTFGGRTYVRGGTLIVQGDAPRSGTSCLGNHGDSNAEDIPLGAENSGTDASILIGGPYTMGREIEIPVDEPSDSGGRVLTVGGCTADESHYVTNIWLGEDINHQTAWGLSVTAASGGVFNLSGQIRQPTNCFTSDRVIRKIGAGTVVFSGDNDYLGETSVEEGTLSLAIGGTLDNASALYISSGATVSISSGVNQAVSDLYLSGEEAFHGYTYGSTASAADFKLDDWFAGSGIITVGGSRDGFSSITNDAATGIGELSATFNGLLTVTNISTAVYVHWGPTDGSNTYSAWSNTAYVGTWTSAFDTAISFTTNGLSGDTTYYYTFRASNTVENIWASPSTNFTTLADVEVNNSTGPTAVSDSSATLRGSLTKGSVATAWICWGDDDGGIQGTSDWDNVVSIGTVTEGTDFTLLVQGLIPNATYWYRCYATNAVGEDWSDDPQSFSGTPFNPGYGGSIAIYTHTSTDEDVLKPEAWDDPYNLDWNQILRQSAEYALDYDDRANVTAGAGHHLVLHNAYYSRSISARRMFHQYIISEGSASAIGWASSHLRSGGNFVLGGGGIIELSAEGVISIQARPTDRRSDDDVDRVANASGFQLMKLDDSWDYCRLSRSAAQVGPTNTTYVKVEYDTQDELDSGSFIHTNGTADIILKNAGHYLVFANTYCSIPSLPAVTTELLHRLVVNGVMVDGSLTALHFDNWNPSYCYDGAAGIGLIIETGDSNAVLNVEAAISGNYGPNYIMPDKTAITIAKLPDDGAYIRLHNENVNTITNFCPDSALVMDWDTADELDADGFTGSYPDSAVTVTADGDYLFLTALYDNDGGAMDSYFWQRWSTNGTSDPITYANGGGMSFADEVGDYSGIMIGLESNTTIEVISEQIGSAGTMNGYSAGVWGMRLATVLPPGTIANREPTDIDGSSATLNGTLYAPNTNYSVYVHFGTTDGGTNFAWDSYYYVGDYGNVASTNVSYQKAGLSIGTTYYYTFRGSNDAGNIWAAPSWEFDTPRPLGSGNLFILF